MIDGPGVYLAGVSTWDTRSRAWVKSTKATHLILVHGTFPFLQVGDCYRLTTLNRCETVFKKGRLCIGSSGSAYPLEYFGKVTCE